MSAQRSLDQKPLWKRPYLIAAIPVLLLLLALAGGAAYVAFAEFPPPTRDVVHVIPDVPFKH